MDRSSRSLVGASLVISGWSKIHKEYWSKETGQGHLVKTGIYRYISHPQYTGFFLITMGVMMTWITIPLLLLYCLLLFLYYGLAKREEYEMEAEFGDEYVGYKKTTKMFIPYAYNIRVMSSKIRLILEGREKPLSSIGQQVTQRFFFFQYIDLGFEYGYYFSCICTGTQD
jgi:hypothetical protein